MTSTKPTPAELRAIHHVWSAAIEGYCSCNGAGSSHGYLTHSVDCWVHIDRANLRRVAAFLRRSGIEVER